MGRQRGLSEVGHTRSEQVGALLQVIGANAKGIVRDTLEIDPKDPWVMVQTMLGELQKYFWTNQNVTVDRRSFEQAAQCEGETFDAFMTRLKGLATDADLCKVCLTSRLTDRVINGVRNQASHLELLRRTAFPSLGEAIELCRTYEVADWDASRGRGLERRSGEVQVIRHTAYKQRQWDEKAARVQSHGQSRGTSRAPCACSRARCGQCG